PTPLLWFCIEYERNPDGTRNLRWVKIPNLTGDGVALRPDDTRLWPNLEYTRRLSLADRTQFTAPTPPHFQYLLKVRQEAGQQMNIPLHQEILLNVQYGEPTDPAKRFIESYVRHVAKTYKHQKRPELEVIGIKLYRAVHIIIQAELLAEGMDPRDPVL